MVMMRPHETAMKINVVFTIVNQNILEKTGSKGWIV